FGVLASKHVKTCWSVSSGNMLQHVFLLSLRIHSQANQRRRMNSASWPANTLKRVGPFRQHASACFPPQPENSFSGELGGRAPCSGETSARQSMVTLVTANAGSCVNGRCT